MAWTDLPTNYTDAIWRGLKRYTQINNSDGTVSFRDDTEYTNRESSFFGADDANKMNGALNSIMSYLKSDSAGAHNAIYRGKFLVNSVTAEQYVEIAAGTFNDLYIGDHWTINDHHYVIAAFNYYRGVGDSQCFENHLLLVTMLHLYQGVMHSGTTTQGGYVGSEMYTSGLDQAHELIVTDFGGTHLMEHREYLCNAVSNGKPSAGAWCSRSVDLLSETMVYGGHIIASPGYGNERAEKTQLPLFRLTPGCLYEMGTFWLRDVVNDTDYALVNGNGLATRANSHISNGVNPYFCIKG